MPDPHLRAADTDREAVATALGRHMADGRLTLAEYDERVAAAWGARTYGDLTRLTADLPAATVVRRPEPAPLVRPPARWGCHDGSLEDSWRGWLGTSVTVLVVYLAIALASWELHYFWPMWVIGPWGAVLLTRSATENHWRGRQELST